MSRLREGDDEHDKIKEHNCSRQYFHRVSSFPRFSPLLLFFMNIRYTLGASRCVTQRNRETCHQLCKKGTQQMADQDDSTVHLTILEKPMGQKTIPAVSARALHEALAVKKDFSDWLRQHTSGEDWHKDKDFNVFPLEGENPKGGRPKMDAAFSLQMAEHISMMTRTKKGRQVREYFRNARDQRDAYAMNQMPRQLTSAQMFLAQAKAMVEIEERQEVIESRQGAQEAALAAIKDRRPPQGKLRIEDWLRREAKPFIGKEVMHNLRYACNQRERPAEFRPEGMDWPQRYYSPETIVDAYEEVTRQLRFLIHDPGVKYRS